MTVSVDFEYINTTQKFGINPVHEQVLHSSLKKSSFMWCRDNESESGGEIFINKQLGDNRMLIT